MEVLTVILLALIFIAIAPEAAGKIVSFIFGCVIYGLLAIIFFLVYIGSTS